MAVYEIQLFSIQLFSFLKTKSAASCYIGAITLYYNII